MMHPITELLQKQAAFEAKLPSGQLFTGNIQSVHRQYHDVISTLALDGLCGPIDTVPRAIVAILGASLRLKFDLAAGLATEQPETANATDFTTLTRTLTQSSLARANTIKSVRELGHSFLASAAHYCSESSKTYDNTAASLLARNEVTKYTPARRKSIFTDSLVYSTQDLLCFIGMMDKVKGRDFSANDIVARIDVLHQRIAPPSVK